MTSTRRKRERAYDTIASRGVDDSWRTVDALLVDGRDAGAAHRRMIRERNSGPDPAPEPLPVRVPLPPAWPAGHVVGGLRAVPSDPLDLCAVDGCGHVGDGEIWLASSSVGCRVLVFLCRDHAAELS